MTTKNASREKRREEINYGAKIKLHRSENEKAWLEQFFFRYYSAKFFFFLFDFVYYKLKKRS